MDKVKNIEKVKNILNRFNFKGDFVSIEPFGSGHINSTYIAEYIDEGKTKHYIIQKVNNKVFKNIDKLMENVFSVTSFLRKKISENGGDVSRETLHFIKTDTGDLYFRDKDRSCYRAYRFVDNSKCLDSVDSPGTFEKSGIAFGRFQRYLSDFPAETLNETIKNFHNTDWRYEMEFLPAVMDDKARRIDTCRHPIDFVMNRADEFSRLVKLAEAGKIPIRVTHNDTKLNNVLFDNDTNDAICVIDLDTVMPGLALYDFGDSIRYGANTCAEDEPDTSLVKINLEYFEAYARGFLSEAGDSLTQCEKDNLAFSAKLMTLECGMRFLADYLNGDIYFKTKYQEHNLIRARNQFALVADMEKHMPEMKRIIKSLT